MPKIYTIAVKNENVKEIESLLWKLQLFVCADRKIPSQLIKKIEKFITTPDAIEEEIYFEDINNIVEKAETYFSSNKDYDFTGKGLIERDLIFKFVPPKEDDETTESYQKRIQKINSQKEFKHYSLSRLTFECLKAFYSKKTKIEKKGIGIRFFYQQIELYALNFSNKHQRELTHYRKTVIATYLANAVGLINPHIENPTNPLLNNKGKDDTKKLNKKK